MVMQTSVTLSVPVRAGDTLLLSKTTWLENYLKTTKTISGFCTFYQNKMCIVFLRASCLINVFIVGTMLGVVGG